MDRQHKENSYLHPSTAFVFLLLKGALGNEWTLVVVHGHPHAIASILLRYRYGCFASGFFLKKNPRQMLSIQLAARFKTRQAPVHRAYRGSMPTHPYLLISRPHKRPGLDADGFETGRGQSRPEKAKLRRLKLHFLPLQLQLLTAKLPACKE